MRLLALMAAPTEQDVLLVVIQALRDAGDPRACGTHRDVE